MSMNKKEAQNKIFDIVYGILEGAFSEKKITIDDFYTATDEKIAEVLKQLNNMPLLTSLMKHLTDADINDIKKRVKDRYAQELVFSIPPKGDELVNSEHVEWLKQVKSKIKWQNWDRYREFLRRSEDRTEEALNGLDEITDLLLDRMENPKSEQRFHSKGLLMGDVQAGKTSTYTALCHKAIDAGYRIILILTGFTNTLRRQTQLRINSDLMGKIVADDEKGKVGVGWAGKVTTEFKELTSVDHDFEVNQLANTFYIDNPNVVAVAVCKKNSSVLNNFISWLKDYGKGQPEIKNLPFLLVDDEADIGSVNTKSRDNPTTINNDIRQILELFYKSAYLAVTATPFANVFIDPQLDSEKASPLPDLFPRDYIYVLRMPPTYLGVEKLFGSEDDVHENEYKDKYLIPLPKSDISWVNKIHQGTLKKQDKIPELPDTLKTAIRYFFCCCAYKDMCEPSGSNASMLVHIDLHIAQQNQIYERIENFIQHEIKLIVLNEAGSESYLRKNADYEEYRSLWEDGCQQEGVSIKAMTFEELTGKKWHQVWSKTFAESASAISAVAVNSSPDSRNSLKELENLNNYFDPKKNPKGARIVCIGGNSLSRGLTLKGLCVTYFSRNSHAYDTLLQMGRWFGYHPRDGEYMRIWMSEGSIEKFEYIATALSEFRQMLYRMKHDGKTPSEFGLRIRRAPAQTRLAITTKKGSSVLITRRVEFAGMMYQSSKLPLSKKLREDNIPRIEEFLRQIKQYQKEQSKSQEYEDIVWSNVPSEYISDLIGKFKVYGWNKDTTGDDLSTYINSQMADSKWEVRLVSPKNKASNSTAKDLKISLGDYSIHRSERQIYIKRHYFYINQGGLAKGGDLARGLTEEEKQKIRQIKEERESEDNEKNIYDITNSDVLNYGNINSPKLLIYVMKITKTIVREGKTSRDANEEDLPQNAEKIDSNENVCGLVVGIPLNPDDKKSSMLVQYQSNRIDQIMREAEEE